MSRVPRLAIDTSESFPHLPGAPIVEAVIHWRARSGKDLQGLEAPLRQALAAANYPTMQTQRELQFKAEVGQDGASQSHTDQWLGFRFTSDDGRQIAQFTRNGFVFSRMAPYENWDRFSTEAKRLWKIHADHAVPVEIERLGVRFINRIAPIELNELDRILTLAPGRPRALPLPIQEFLHRTLFAVPGHPYTVNVNQTTSPPATEGPGLILDIDVFTTETMEIDEIAVDHRLSEMRWLKNRAFFSLLTPEAIDRFKEGS